MATVTISVTKKKTEYFVRLMEHEERGSDSEIRKQKRKKAEVGVELFKD